MLEDNLIAPDLLNTASATCFSDPSSKPSGRKVTIDNQYGKELILFNYQHKTGNKKSIKRNSVQNVGILYRK